MWLDSHHHVEVSAKGQKIWKPMDEDVEEPSFGRPHHGENRDAVPKPKEAQGGISFEVCNDLQVAIEVNPGTGWKVLYPAERFRIDTLPPVDVAARLRDDRDICGTCCVGATALLRATEAFGHFGPAAVEFIEAEQREVEHERQLREARFEKLKFALLGHRPPRNVCEEKEKCGFMILIVLVMLIGCGGFHYMILDVLHTEADLTFASAVMTIAVVSGFCVMACLFWALLGKAKNRAAAEVKLLGGEVASSCGHRCEARLSYFWLVSLTASVVVLTVLCCITSPWFALIFGPAWLCWCCMFMYCYWKTHHKDRGEEEVHEAAQNTIVFNGRVLDSHPLPWLDLPPCVCSWPGKYESAWDSLVKSTRDRGLSAAVVFLPEGSEHFGSHDPIPPAEALEGDCWCIPLYGEKKPWGCRWWTLWIANIEKAVEYGAELLVFFFEKKKGLGRVESFATAGQENLRREAIWQRKAEFEESVEFQNAKAAGLGKLSKGQCLDSSSQYTREWQRLFLAWLPEKDRQFLEASEGLGNSQKAEVAWLERKGYAYKEVELDAATWIRLRHPHHPR